MKEKVSCKSSGRAFSLILSQVFFSACSNQEHSYKPINNMTHKNSTLAPSYILLLTIFFIILDISHAPGILQLLG